MIAPATADAAITIPSAVSGSSNTELDGSFTGTVEGDEVFSTENLGG
jgi:hypothetical protein